MRGSHWNHRLCRRAPAWGSGLPAGQQQAVQRPRWPAVGISRGGRPRVSTARCILLLRPPLDRPGGPVPACAPLPLAACRWVRIRLETDRNMAGVGGLAAIIEEALANACLCPAGEAFVYGLPRAVTLRQTVPLRTGPQTPHYTIPTLHHLQTVGSPRRRTPEHVPFRAKPGRSRAIAMRVTRSRLDITNLHIVEPAPL